MRRLLYGILLLLIAGVFSFPYLADKQIPARFFSGPTIVKLYVHGDNKIHYLQLEDYLVGVVAAEMPASFPAEALKAQAVCARTYVAKRIDDANLIQHPHPGADICDDPAHGQAWLSRKELKERWGTVEHYRYYYKIKQSVDDTAGQVLTWNEVLIDPAYHAVCGGRTENAEDVWQTAVPYLRSVVCPYEADPNLVQSVSFSLEQVDGALGTNIAAIPAAAGGDVSDSIALLEKTSTGRPKSLAFGEKELAATVVRERLGLRSSNFTWSLQGDSITFTTTGHGHGTGMCQYGAKGLAEHGYSYRVILSHYYNGTEIK